MKKDKEWLKGLINEEGIVMNRNSLGRNDEQNWKNENIKINKGRLFYLIDQLDEPEVLSHEWIYKHKKGVFMDNKGRKKDFVWVDDLQNLLVPKQDKPVIPQFVADWIEEERANIIDWHTEIPERFFLILGHKLHYTALANTNISDWVFGGNEEKLYQALKYGYEVEKEQKYQVIIRGGEYIRLYLCKHGDNVMIGTNDNYIEKCPEVTYLTEQEIKDYDKRFWAFAEEVTEN